MAFLFQTLFPFMSVLLLCIHPLSCLSPPSLRCHQPEHDALLSFKAAINDSRGSLSSWVRGSDCCGWEGVACDNLTNHVVDLALLGVHISSENSLHDWQSVISDSVCQLPYLQYLDLTDNGLGGTLPPCLGNLSHLQQLYLYANDLNGTIPPCLCNLFSLQKLHLYYNQLSGSIPSCLCNLSSLQELSFDNNRLSGTIPSCFGNLSSLQVLNLAANQLSGTIPFSLGELSSLEYFIVIENNLSGTLPPSFAKLSSLRRLVVDGNDFNESISSSALPSSIESLYLSLPHNEPISETFFTNLPNLYELWLEDCIFNMSTSWIPSFQLSTLGLVSCKINGQFPPWISTQYSLEILKLVGNNLVGEIPSWVWDTSSELRYVDFSGNQLDGNLYGIATTWHCNITYLALNDNLLSGSIPPVLGTFSKLQLLNLANNNFSGNIPSALASCSDLQVLNLGNNSLEGRIPRWFGNLSHLDFLVLHYNKLEGTIPHSVTNCTNLRFLDVGHNSLEGRIPKSIRHLSALQVFVLRENRFGGGIPSEIGQLTQLQILDLSTNGFSGSIPHNISFLKAMAIASNEGSMLSDFVSYGINVSTDYLYQINMISKGVYLHYNYIYSTLTEIDLSNNRLSGEVPSDIGNLKGLWQLNLSMNNLSSSIPDSLGDMSRMESLDLSRNRFSGKIPQSVVFLNNLGKLDLSNNNLSGPIPQGSHLLTFESAFSANPYLWGCPLPKNCSWPKYASAPLPPTIEIRRKRIPWYGIALGLSYGAGFGGTLTLIAAFFYQKYFEKVDIVLKILFPWLNNWIV